MTKKAKGGNPLKILNVQRQLLSVAILLTFVVHVLALQAQKTGRKFESYIQVA